MIVFGDSIHAICPFKGQQGHNQALTDGSLLSLWLEKSVTNSTIKGFLVREMTQRTNKIVIALKDTAQSLFHDEDFAGISVKLFIQTLQKAPYT